MDTLPPPVAELRPSRQRSASGYILPLLFLALLAYVAYRFDIAGQFAILLAVFGIGFIVFIHELGHFLVAKACDVHVQAFSIGFGPPLPGCKFQRGETTYLIGCFPLGGYVKMVGEGLSTKAGDTDPRSYKNKTVWQRMAIISAGVVMNVILGFACFAFVFMTRGVERMRLIIDKIETGSPAWQAGMKTGDVMHQIGDKGPDPDFEQYLSAVVNTREGQRLDLVYGPYGAGPEAWTRVQIEPRREADDPKPMTGIVLIQRLHLLPDEFVRLRQYPYQYGSAAAAARVLKLQPGDVVIASSDPARPDVMKDLPTVSGGTNFGELCRRMRRLVGRPMSIQVRRQGEATQTEACEDGFEFGDIVTGLTDPDQDEETYDPYRLKPLRLDETEPEAQRYDWFDSSARMKRLTGKPVVFQVRRQGTHPGDPAVPVLVPPAYYQSPGMRLRMGRIFSVRLNSPAAGAGVCVDDRIAGVEVVGAGEHKIRFTNDQPPGPAPDGGEVRPLDPARLPAELWRWSADVRSPAKVTLTLLRGDSPGRRVTLEIPWDDTRRFTNEVWGRSWLFGIPCLGIGYQAETTVDAVESGSPAARAGLQRGDVIEGVRFRKVSPRADEKPEPERWEDLKPAEGGHVLAVLQMTDSKTLDLRIKRRGEKLELTMTAEPDETWPVEDRGLGFVADHYLHRAANPWEAARLGLNKTQDFIFEMYRNMSSMVSRRVSHEMLLGPIGLSQLMYETARSSVHQFVLIMGIISVSLAVMNFLPIPVLDGGHMVFLVYEKIRGRRVPHQVEVAATYFGLFLILCLLVLVCYVDISRR